MQVNLEKDVLGNRNCSSIHCCCDITNWKRHSLIKVLKVDKQSVAIESVDVRLVVLRDINCAIDRVYVSAPSLLAVVIDLLFSCHLIVVDVVLVIINVACCGCCCGAIVVVDIFCRCV